MSEKKKCWLDREHEFEQDQNVKLAARCDVRIESVTSCSGAMPRLSPFTLLCVCSFFFLLCQCLACCLWSERSIPPTHTHTHRHTLSLSLSLYYLRYLLYSSATWWKETTWDFWEWVKLIVRVQKTKKRWRYKKRQVLTLDTFLKMFAFYYSINHEWLHFFMSPSSSSVMFRKRQQGSILLKIQFS